MAHPPIVLEHWLALGYFRGITTTTAKRLPMISVGSFRGVASGSVCIVAALH